MNGPISAPEARGAKEDSTGENLLRELAPQVLGAVIRRFGDFSAADNVGEEALLAAAMQWTGHRGEPSSDTAQRRPELSPSRRKDLVHCHRCDRSEMQCTNAWLDGLAVADDHDGKSIFLEILLRGALNVDSMHGLNGLGEL